MKSVGVIFDMDGVVVDSMATHYEAFKQLGKKLNRPFTPELLVATVGMHNNQIFPLWIGDHLTPERITELAFEKESLYRTLAQDQLKAIPGVLELLEILQHEKIALAVGSSGPQENVELALRVLNVKKYFSGIVTGSDVTHGKPHPEIFLKAAQKLQMPATSCIVIEDALQGVKAARAAGMRVIAVTTSTPRESLLSADHVVDSLHELHDGQLLFGRKFF
jgi:beta-phosphoglucomutase